MFIQYLPGNEGANLRIVGVEASEEVSRRALEIDCPLQRTQPHGVLLTDLRILIREVFR